MFKLAYFYFSFLIIFLTACSSGGGDSQSNGELSLTGELQKTELPPPSILSATPANLPEFMAFESGHVRPLAISENGQQLYAVNTPDNRLEVFTISASNLTHIQSIPVGMEPVAVAVINNQAWVVNHLSDSVSIVDFSQSPARVIRTLLVGDEPRDIVFAGTSRSRAFITTAHRGQNSPVDPQLNTAGLGRADVWVFDRSNLGNSLGGDPLTIVNLFGDTPRALATNVDGSRVYVAVLNSGNQTTVIARVPTNQKAPPFVNAEGISAPESAYIVKYNGSNWVDEAGQIFDDRARLNLPDFDVFELNATASLPAEINRWSGVGTTLFNMAVNPQNGNIYVSNTEARNHIRFEGFGGSASTVRGHFAESRISILNASGVSPQHLNTHIDRNRLIGTAAERQTSLALPLEVAITQNGQQLYVAAMGSNKIAVLDATALDNNTFDPQLQTHIAISGGGPTGVVLDEARQQAYVLTRYDNGISVINTATQREVSHVQMFNPEPESITNGRPFLYDANLTSSTGDASCALCHVFADTDHLSWDLGNPDEDAAPNPFFQVPFTQPLSGNFTTQDQNFHPMKGPKGTQSLRGMPNHGPLHWRGDRTGQNPVNGESLEEAAFKEFNGAFPTLLGREFELTDTDMQAFTDFAMQISYPPNPHRPLSNTLTDDQLEGRRVYTNVFTSPGGRVGCNTCHVLDSANGHFGSAADFIAVLGENDQDFKVPHFRNIYQKVGLFRQGLNQPQIRGFGISETAATPGLLALINGGEFQFENNQQPEQLADFIFAYDTLLAPIVGQQITLTENSPASVNQRIDLLMSRAQVTGNVPECDLIIKGVWGGETRGAVRLANDIFQTDRNAQQLTLQQIKDLAVQAGNHITFTCAPPNSGRRMGIDRDLDGVFDAD